MKSAIRLLLLAAFIPILAGCTSMKMKRQLKKQLQMGGRYKVQVLSFDAQRGKAWVKLWDQTHDNVTETPRCPYRYEQGRWVSDPNAVFDMRPALNEEDRTHIRQRGAVHPRSFVPKK